MPPPAPHTERCSVVIVGAGYAGLSAFNAAVKYLKPGDTVVVVDRGHRWGGQWVDQYDFVRLHQPYTIFTAGERPWAFEGSKPPGHLATKTEILAHFEDIVSAAVSESGVRLVPLFGYAYTSHAIRDGAVELTVDCCLERTAPLPPPASISIRADRMIKATGFEIEVKRPFSFASPRVLSMCPADILRPAWNAAMLADRGRPIYFIGSGKTAMDCIYHLCSRDSADVYRSRIHCIAGRGMYFINRDLAFPTGFWERNAYGSNLMSDYFLKMLRMYDGTNECEIYRQMERERFFHSAIPEPASMVLGICSVEELDVVRAALSPPAEKVMKAHLVSIDDDPDDDDAALLSLTRAGDGKAFTHRVPRGAVVINCTDSLGTDKQNYFDPIISGGGLVLSPGGACGFSGPTAHLLTHSWYLGKLEAVWRDLIRAEAGKANKHRVGMQGLYLLTYNLLWVSQTLPFHLQFANRTDPLNLFPPHRRPPPILRAMFTLRRLWPKHSKFMTLRYTDKQPTDRETADVMAARASRGLTEVAAKDSYSGRTLLLEETRSKL